MKITTILKDIFLALASTLLFGGGIGFVGVCIFDARISTMLHISAYIFLLMLAMWLFIDYQEMKSRQSIQQAIREEEEKQQRMKEEKQRAIRQLDQKYGHCSYVMAPYKKPNATDLVRIYPEARMMVIQGKEYRYDEILSCRISERDVNDTAMETHTVTTTDNAHVARRIAAGAMIGGILLGIIEQLSKGYISSQLSDAIVFLVLIIVLVVRPTGILGKKINEKV